MIYIEYLSYRKGEENDSGANFKAESRGDMCHPGSPDGI
jgi:hypothetical protein